MSGLKYSILCEDSAHFTFISIFLSKFNYQHDIEINFVSDFYNRFKATNSKEVLKKYSKAAIIGFRDYSLDFLIVGIDYDDRDRSQFEKEVNSLYSRFDGIIRKKSIIMFPVQAIEHWLLYIQYHVNNPKSTKNIVYESIPRREAKSRIYGDKLNRRDRIEIVTNLVLKIDIDWLLSRSESFKRFHFDLKNVLIQD